MNWMSEQPPARRVYERGELDESSVRATWLEQFQDWFAAASADPLIPEPNAMQLATAAASGRPSVRTVLLKGLDERGLVFFSGYDSDKGADLAARPYASAVFAWLAQERQVRLSGPVTRVDRDETQEYFRTRPRGSQLGAWASPQSRVLGSRAELDALLAATEQRFDGVDDIPAPPNWGGFRLAPESVEFWQGRRDRLHDRLRFQLVDGAWALERLAP
jgi:pyridoxamine 5'-phosphate oxidase